MENRYKETFDTWNKVASLYQDTFMDLNIYDKTYDVICADLKQNATILEIGCGPGNITRYLLSKRPDFKISGIDIAPNMIELARANNPNACFAIMDSREISNINHKYDGIIVGFCLPYLSCSESEKLIFDSKVLLHEQGLLYLSFVEGDPEKSGFQLASSGDRIYFYYHNLENLMVQLKANSFEDLKLIRVNYKKSAVENEMHTIIIATKNTNEL